MLVITHVVLRFVAVGVKLFWLFVYPGVDFLLMFGNCSVFVSRQPRDGRAFTGIIIHADLHSLCRLNKMPSNLLPVGLLERTLHCLAEQIFLIAENINHVSCTSSPSCNNKAKSRVIYDAVNHLILQTR